MAKSSVTKSELEDLKAAGFVEGNKNTIPENISPVLKSKLLKEMGENSSGHVPGIPGDYDALDHDHNGVRGGHVDNRGKRTDK